LLVRIYALFNQPGEFRPLHSGILLADVIEPGDLRFLIGFLAGTASSVGRLCRHAQ
jgi:hypothetical protein